MTSSHSVRLAVVAAGLAVATSASAQAWNYPAFQPPRTMAREYNFGVAGGGGTSAVAQWREGLSATTQFNVEAGLNDPSNVGVRFMFGGGLAMRLTTASTEMPLDIVAAGGLYPSFGQGLTTIRIPIGAIVGRRFVTQGGLGVSPYAAPRLSIDYAKASGCTGSGCSNTDLDFDFEIGGDVELTQNMSIRAGVVFSSGQGNDTGFGVSFAYRPAAIRSKPR